MDSLITAKLQRKITLPQYLHQAPHYHRYILSPSVETEILLAFLTSLCNNHDEYQELLYPQNAPEDRKSPLDTLPTDLLVSVKETLATVFDFVLETYIVTRPQWSTQTLESGSIIEESIMAGSYISCEESEQTVFACVLWKTQVGDPNSSIYQLQKATGCTTEAAQKIATLSQNIERLVRIGTSLASCGLHVTIRSGRDTFREEIAGLLLRGCMSVEENGYLKALYYSAFPDGEKTLTSRFTALYTALTGRVISESKAELLFESSKHTDEYDFVVLTLGALRPYSLVLI
ncbi:hypothetical protein K493DRAFT_343019 [Basidiobolus meristosporus CBS 931.73]|uniref:Uncharacterized protein n=1 Tax=Basidiobolus meristosporus CBS 931.73 TaxID=1314790 RepID=A0A1Y1WT41_9FUNG|nr:hypothetical protein K493DRAFT_343019 [Basidiobolus meristosporus CBS 931.73]|eukprot:ORX76458.1 hypothetical protein K493DRAFT_343019 [Basidiobolus meristosporus CBS 931.73]